MEEVEVEVEVDPLKTFARSSKEGLDGRFMDTEFDLKQQDTLISIQLLKKCYTPPPHTHTSSIIFHLVFCKGVETTVFDFKFDEESDCSGIKGEGKDEETKELSAAANHFF